MAGKVQLALWVHYDSESGYVWPQVYGTEKDAELDERMNYPIKKMRLTSEPYTCSRTEMELRASRSFGTRLSVRAKRPKRRAKKGERK